MLLKLLTLIKMIIKILSPANQSANIDDDLKKAMKCCEVGKEKTIGILIKAVNKQKI